MQRIRCYIVITIFLLGTVNIGYAKTVQLKTFDEILKTLTSGKAVKAVFHYKGCKLIRDNEEVERVPDAIGAMELNTFEYFAPGLIGNKNGYISSSKTVLINHPGYGFVLNYAKVRIFDNNKIRIIAQYVTPNTYEIKMDESFYTVINDGKNKGAAYFYLKE